MKFTPCASECSSSGSHCEGCGRSHEEIKATLALVRQLTDHMLAMDYDNPQEFTDMIAAKVMKRYIRELKKIS